MKLVEKARLVAMTAHGATGQKRKYTNEPYFVHPEGVVKILATETNDPSVLAAGYLHDVVEDTEITNDDIVQLFGPKIGMYVHYVTKHDNEDMPREARNKLIRDTLNFAPYESQLIKLADITHNMSTIENCDEKFIKRYVAEKRKELDALTKVTDTNLYKELVKTLDTHS